MTAAAAGYDLAAEVESPTVRVNEKHGRKRDRGETDLPQRREHRVPDLQPNPLGQPQRRPRRTRNHQKQPDRTTTADPADLQQLRVRPTSRRTPTSRLTLARLRANVLAFAPPATVDAREARCYVASSDRHLRVAAQLMCPGESRDPDPRFPDHSGGLCLVENGDTWTRQWQQSSTPVQPSRARQGGGHGSIGSDGQTARSALGRPATLPPCKYARPPLNAPPGDVVVSENRRGACATLEV